MILKGLKNVIVMGKLYIKGLDLLGISKYIWMVRLLEKVYEWLGFPEKSMGG